MSPRARRLLPLLALGLASAARAGVPLAVEAAVHFGDAVEVRLTATNATAGPLRAVHPQLRYRQAEREGEPVGLAAGASHTWTVSFPLPPGPSGDALVVTLRLEDAAARKRSQPWARSVETPGLLPTEAELIADAGPGEEARVRVVNATGEPLRGRLVAAIPEECFTEPVAQPLEVPPRATVAVPIHVQDCDLPPGTAYPVFAILRFAQGGIPRVVVASTVLAAGVAPPPGTANPLLIGAAALALAIALLALAQALARRRRA